MIDTETKFYILYRLLPSVVMIFFFFFVLEFFLEQTLKKKFGFSSITIIVPPIARHFLKTNKAIRLFVLATASGTQPSELTGNKAALIVMTTTKFTALHFISVGQSCMF